MISRIARDVYRPHLPVADDDGATPYLLDMGGASEDAVGEFERAVVVAAALEKDDIRPELGYLFNGRVFSACAIQSENSYMAIVWGWGHFVILHAGSGDRLEKIRGHDAVGNPDNNAQKADARAEDQPRNKRREGEHEAACPEGQGSHERHRVRSGPEDGSDDDPQAQGDATQSFPELVDSG